MTVDTNEIVLSIGKIFVQIPMVTEDHQNMYVLNGTRIGTEEVNQVQNVPKIKRNTKMPERMDINDAHALCHWGETLRTTFHGLGIELQDL